MMKFIYRALEMISRMISDEPPKIGKIRLEAKKFAIGYSSIKPSETQILDKSVSICNYFLSRLNLGMERVFLRSAIILLVC